MRRQVAMDRANRALSGMLADMPDDRELVFETIRALIRGASKVGKRLAGEGRAAGVLCGALVDVSPAYRPDVRFSDAEALFKSKGGAK